MHNTRGYVALMNNRLENYIPMILCSIQDKSSSPFLSVSMLLECS